MEIAEIYYKAKDGKIFLDPLECEEYEKKIGILDGSVGDLIHTLEKVAQPKDYIFGIALVRKPNGAANVYTRCTAYIGYKLEDYVNVENLSKEQLYESATVDDLIQALKQEDKDLPCQYFLIWSENIDMHGFSMMSNHNKAAWPKDEDKK